MIERRKPGVSGSGTGIQGSQRNAPATGAARSAPVLPPGGTVDDFVRSAPGKQPLAWQMPGAREDFKRALNVDIADDVLLKMEHLARHFKVSKRVMTERLMEAAADAELRALGIEP